MAAKKSRAAKSYRGLPVRVVRATTTRARKELAEGAIVQAAGDPGPDGWLPIMLDGRLDQVQRADVERLAAEKLTREEQAARRRQARADAGAQKSSAQARSNWR